MHVLAVGPGHFCHYPTAKVDPLVLPTKREGRFDTSARQRSLELIPAIGELKLPGELHRRRAFVLKCAGDLAIRLNLPGDYPIEIIGIVANRPVDHTRLVNADEAAAFAVVAGGPESLI